MYFIFNIHALYILIIYINIQHLHSMTCSDRPIFAQVRNVDSFASALCGETTLRPLGWAAEIEDGFNGYPECDGHG